MIYLAKNKYLPISLSCIIKIPTAIKSVFLSKCNSLTVLLNILKQLVLGNEMPVILLKEWYSSEKIVKVDKNFNLL